jgi:hypothetical protein
MFLRNLRPVTKKHDQQQLLRFLPLDHHIHQRKLVEEKTLTLRLPFLLVHHQRHLAIAVVAPQRVQE